MAITFYYGSGSPFSWKVWLALAHKQLSYDLKVLSLQQGEQKKPEYLAVNPRGKVPALIDDGYVFWDSAAIVEYLEERYPERPILPHGLRERANARRVVAEANQHLYPVLRRVLEQTLFRPDGGGDETAIALALEVVQRELSYFEDTLLGEYFADTLSLADFTLYPMLALVQRLREKQPQHTAGVLLGPRLSAFMRRIEQLPYFAQTVPPHWKAWRRMVKQMHKPVCVVAGVGPGNGAAFARRFAAEGYRLALLSRHTGFSQKLAEQQDDARAYACNVTDPVAVAHTFKAICAELGEADALVYNPDIGVWANVEEITPEAIEIEARPFGEAW